MIYSGMEKITVIGGIVVAISIILFLVTPHIPTSHLLAQVLQFIVPLYMIGISLIVTEFKKNQFKISIIRIAVISLSLIILSSFNWVFLLIQWFYVPMIFLPTVAIVAVIKYWKKSRTTPLKNEKKHNSMRQ